MIIRKDKTFAPPLPILTPNGLACRGQVEAWWQHREHGLGNERQGACVVANPVARPKDRPGPTNHHANNERLQSDFALRGAAGNTALRSPLVIRRTECEG